MRGRIFVAAMAALMVTVSTQSVFALTVRTLSGSAIGMPSTFERAASSPRSTFVQAGPDSELQSVFIASEVAPDRIETTRTLLGELKARRTGGAIVVDLPADVLFDFDKASLRPDAGPAIGKARSLLQSYPAARVAIAGHTDSMGSDAYNNDLSLRRARTVATALEASGERSFAIEGLGERRPLVSNTLSNGADDPEGRQKNRRVEIRITPTPPQAGN
ncbi:MAG: OmpA family protein [Alphaproteobacteria bacterium]|nr:MAG: OmpA family protein [Alphaproteobacteria bacterium]